MKARAIAASSICSSDAISPGGGVGGCRDAACSAAAGSAAAAPGAPAAAGSAAELGPARGVDERARIEAHRAFGAVVPLSGDSSPSTSEVILLHLVVDQRVDQRLLRLRRPLAHHLDLRVADERLRCRAT